MLEPKDEASYKKSPALNGWFTKMTVGAPFSSKHMGFPCPACHSLRGKRRKKLGLGAGQRGKPLVAVYLFQL